MELTTSDEALGILAYRPVFHAELVPGVWWDTGELVEVGKGGAGEDEGAHGSGKSRVARSLAARLMVFWEIVFAESRKVWKSVWASSED